MSCGNNVFRTAPNFNSCGNNCVSDTVRDIVLAQNEVANNDCCCNTGCHQSIMDLLSPGNTTNNGGPTTVPFILYCKGDCNPFIASGVFKQSLPGGYYFDCLQTPILRAKQFVDGSDKCVRVELLAPVNAAGDIPVTEGTNVCDFFPAAPNQVQNFQATGICITIDLDCYCSITCLDAITPLPVS